MTANENCTFVLNEEIGKYEIATPADKTEANVQIDDSVGKGILEVEMESSNWVSGIGWNNGISLCKKEGYRNVVFTALKNIFYLNNNATILASDLSTKTTYKVKLDNTKYSDAFKGVDVYVNDELLISNASKYVGEKTSTNSYLWTNSADTRIKAIRYKKVTE